MPMDNLYKDAAFYDAWFNNVERITLTENFQLSDQRFVGTFEFNDTIHPLVVRVEIPKNFPHHKLYFYTRSLAGYPHLIRDEEKKGSWFCLNAPFAETAEAQLQVEFSRLEGWIDRQMRPDLKPVIDDPKVIMALRRANAYDWQNPDEMNEFRKEAMLNFIGDGWQDASRYDSPTGTFPCIQNASNRMFVSDRLSRVDVNLPYVIVDELPEDSCQLLSMRMQYNWTAEIMHHILPEVFPKAYFIHEMNAERNLGQDKGFDRDEALQRISQAREILRCRNLSETHQECIDSCFQELEKEIDECGRIKGWFENNFLFTALPPEDEEDDEAMERWQYQQNAIEYSSKVYPFEAHHFVLGIRSEDIIHWRLISMDRTLLTYSVDKYDLGVKELTIKELTSVDVLWETAQYISENRFFGRGRLCQPLRDLHIAILGVGAVGSMIAESLVRGGVHHLSLWDNDLVEPGNICRSAYSMYNMGDNKANALATRLWSLSPFCKVNIAGYWGGNADLNWYTPYTDGMFYGNINYAHQINFKERLDDYDLVIDCTASNELLHFLSYAVKEGQLLSCCITNRAQDMLCLSSRDGNVFEQRRMLLSRIEQDTDNFYVEGTGCLEPTFLAGHCDISALAGLFIRELNAAFSDGSLMHSTVFSHRPGGVVADRMQTFRLQNDGGIRLSVSSETLLDADELDVTPDGTIGYVLGCYSHDGTHILVSHFIPADDAEERLTEVFDRSSGILDYIGDFTLSFDGSAERADGLLLMLAAKAEDTGVNTRNPLLAVRQTDGSIGFYLYMNGRLLPFVSAD